MICSVYFCISYNLRLTAYTPKAYVDRLKLYELKTKIECIDCFYF